MLDLDLNDSPPQPKSLAETQQAINALWSSLGKALEEIQQLKERLDTHSRNSSQSPSSDSPQQLQEQWHLRFSTGAISQAQGKVLPWLAPLYHQIGGYVRQAQVAHADETTHYRGSERRWLWCLATPLAVYFLTHYSRGNAAAMALLGYFSGVLVTDHYVSYNDYDPARRQLCWAHLIRRLEHIAQRVGDAGDIGQRLLVLARAVMRTQHRWYHEIAVAQSRGAATPEIRHERLHSA